MVAVAVAGEDEVGAEDEAVGVELPSATHVSDVTVDAVPTLVDVHVHADVDVPELVTESEEVELLARHCTGVP